MSSVEGPVLSRRQDQVRVLPPVEVPIDLPHRPRPCLMVEDEPAEWHTARLIRVPLHSCRLGLGRGKATIAPHHPREAPALARQALGILLLIPLIPVRPGHGCTLRRELHSRETCCCGGGGRRSPRARTTLSGSDTSGPLELSLLV